MDLGGVTGGVSGIKVVSRGNYGWINGLKYWLASACIPWEGNPC
jgi:hypothetical protein